jgi:NAD+ synthase (glutamine-hydrolysing)
MGNSTSDSSTVTSTPISTPTSPPASTPTLTADLVAKLNEYRTARNFNPEAWTVKKCQLLNDYMRKSNLKTCVVSVSGGVDSAVTLALCHFASKMQNSPITSVVGVCQPIKSSEWALNRGKEVINAFNAKEIIVDQSDIHTQLVSLVEKGSGISGNDFANGQLRSYMRTPIGYYVAQLFSSNGEPAIVMGTGNKDEDGYLAYFCKAGDGVVDVQLISDLHKSEVFKVGAFLKVPESILNAAPSADLWAGQTDEQELGFTYDFIELFTGWFLTKARVEQDNFIESLDDDSKNQFADWRMKAVTIHKRNAHKLNGVVNL